MSVKEFMDYHHDKSYAYVIIYDCDIAKDIYTGAYLLMPYEMEYMEVIDFDIEMRNDKPYICLSVE